MEHRFGFVENGKMVLNKFGKIARQCLNNLPNFYDQCFLDEIIIMPNHIHCIIVIDNDTVGDDFLSSPVEKTKPPMFSTKPPMFSTKPPIEPIKTGDGKKPSPTNANKTHGLSEMVRSFKHYVTRNINEINSHTTFKWQRSFNDHIIRNEKELYAIRKYICDNPINW
ncbi:MAG: hypothetical protein GQ534_11315 [Candidatus Delongbacteria bacterium]|nr:hypothetical protein [Candidatus Delongbacteria bacterium]